MIGYDLKGWSEFGLAAEMAALEKTNFDFRDVLAHMHVFRASRRLVGRHMMTGADVDEGRVQPLLAASA